MRSIFNRWSLFWLIISILVFIQLYILADFKFTKPYLWSYWQDINGTPAYIPLCKETIDKHCDRSFKIRYLNETTIKQYIPQKYLKAVQKLTRIQHRTDYYRIYLLYHYGGVWLDADTIVIKNFKPLYDKYTNDCAFIGCHLCGYHKYNFPNGIIFAERHSKVMKETLRLLDNQLNQSEKLGYFDYGKKIIYQAIKNLEKHKIFHYGKIPNQFIFYKDLEGTYVSDEHHFSEDYKISKSKLIIYPNDKKSKKIPTILYKKYKDIFLAVLLNNANHRNKRSFINSSRTEILQGNSFVSKLFRSSLNR